MPLAPPNLDTRLFEDLLAEARLRIARYNPDWTDFNESDPGITLVQLFAWFTELMLAQLNQVPSLNYIKFLQLLGFELQPAQPAVAQLTFLSTPGIAADPVPPGTQVVAQPAGGGEPLIFETEAGLDLVRVPLTDIQVFDGSTFTVVTAANVAGSPDFAPFGKQAQLGSALYLGFTPPDPPSTVTLFPQRFTLRVFLPQQALAGAPLPANAVDVHRSAPVRLLWEYHPAAEPDKWQSLRVYDDHSIAFTREGSIELEGPGDITLTKNEGQIADPRFWIRVKLLDGAYPAGHVPVVDFVRTNTVAARNVATLQDEELGRSKGTPRQTFQLYKRPVLAESLVLHVEGAGSDPVLWERRDDFFASAPGDRHYTLQANTGVITFGDGTHGLIPAAGSLIVAARYGYGGGEAGNVAAGSITGMPGNIQGLASVTNERAAAGGRNEQDVEDLKASAPHQLRTRNRAVTADDFKTLAEQAGEVAKATALSQRHPDYPGVAVPGAVTVVVVPDTTEIAPRPSVDQTRNVARYLNEYRLLTTELFVKGPAYTTIDVIATVAAQKYMSFEQVREGIVAALTYYLDPLARVPQTPKLSDYTLAVAGRDEWNFGDTLHPTTLFSVVLSVDGVSYVKALTLAVNGKPVEHLAEPITLPADGLFASGQHQVTLVPA